MKIAIVTDSNAGLVTDEAKGIFVLPMSFLINEEEYFENVNLTQEKFYELLEEGSNVSTSQPAPAAILELWDRILKDYDRIVHIPLSSSLSNSCQTAALLAEDYDGKVEVVNNYRISVTQRRSVEAARLLADQGKDAAEIRRILEETALDSSIYITLDTLTYLKRGGRITPAAAAIGTILRLKPVLQIQGGKLDAFAKARTMKQAKSLMIEAIRKDMAERFGDTTGKLTHIDIAHTKNDEAAEEFARELQAEFPEMTSCQIDPLSLVVSCHIGPGSLAVAVTRKLPEEQ